ncbi:hypothetical protein EAS62_36790 [Bradyrhizobium zhanjiangense]|uniref:Nucleotidyl transferase domain-containing protein n=1 Tax=Bradyrhizobium zhanjiangense TaxID=1325107 RepID=A0ABY0D9K1_9BRAD|nr:hypothetical protein EAS62_36790 [Bradyrhizobium zhanjiangense]
MPLNAPKHALILAAGVGSRLRPLTELNPKPLVQIHGTPILHNALISWFWRVYGPRPSSWVLRRAGSWWLIKLN